jgi:tetratricopeptide (TPR) repeat protein
LLDKRLSIIEELLGERPDDFKLRIEAADTYTTIGNRLLRADFEKGYQYYQEKVLPTLAEAQRLAPDDAETVRLERIVYNRLGWYASEHGRLAEELGASREDARKYFERALEYFQKIARIYEKQFQSNPEDTSNRRGHIIGIVNVGIALRDVDRIDEALAHLKRGHSLYQELARFDTNNLQAVFDLGDLYAATALCHVKKSEYAEAINYFQKSLAHMEKVISTDPKHHEAINYKVDVLTQLGNTCAEAGSLSKALNYYEQARDFAGKNLTAESGDRIQIGRIYLSAGRAFIRFAENEASQSKASELWRRAQAELEKAAEIIKETQVEETANQMRVIENQLLKCQKALQPSK